MNQLTSFLDASHIYGSTKEDALDLRELTQGQFETHNLHSTAVLLLALQIWGV